MGVNRMKRSIWTWATASLLTTVIALVVEVSYVLLQTEPTTTDPVVSGIAQVLLMAGVVMISIAYWNWKQEVNYFVALIPIVTGLVGVGAVLYFSSDLVNIFFPRVSITQFLGIDFMSILMVGVILLIFGHVKPSWSNDR
jgi:hypothetical protein